MGTKESEVRIMKYYRNSRTGEETCENEVMNSWHEDGDDVEFWGYSDVLQEYVCRMILEGK